MAFIADVSSDIVVSSGLKYYNWGNSTIYNIFGNNIILQVVDQGNLAEYVVYFVNNNPADAKIYGETSEIKVNYNFL